MAGTAIELRTGTDPNGSEADIFIGLTVNSVRNFLVFKTDDYSQVQSNRVDALSVFLHEVALGLGIVYMTDDAEAPGVSVYDTLISGNLFVGQRAPRHQLEDGCHRRLRW